MILFISTGGTIDKLYPRTVRCLKIHKKKFISTNFQFSGYNFEFGPPAVNNILNRIKPKLSQDVV